MDRISHLPFSILDNILGRLPLMEAIRTSVLSKEWRYKWVNLSKLVIPYRFRHEEDLGRQNVDFVTFVYYVLLSHRGYIHNFKIDATQFGLKISFCHLDNWINFLVRNGIKELILACNLDDLYKIPSCLFYCQQLTHLEMHKISLEPPVDVKGFKNLVRLQLDDFCANADALSSLISNSPSLEILQLTEFTLSGCLIIRAPRLKYLHLLGFFPAIVLENCLVLEKIVFEMLLDLNSDNHLEEGQSCHFLQSLSRLSSLKDLAIRGLFLQNQHMWGTSAGLVAASNNFNWLNIDQFSLTHLCEITVALDILKLFSNLKHLSLRVEDREHTGETSDVLHALSQSSCLFNRLEFAEIYLMPDFNKDLKYWEPELQFLEFLLARAPVLKRLTIGYSRAYFPCLKAFRREVLSFKRASPDVEILHRPF